MLGMETADSCEEEPAVPDDVFTGAVIPKLWSGVDATARRDLAAVGFLQSGRTPIGSGTIRLAARRLIRTLAPCKNGCLEGIFTRGGTPELQIHIPDPMPVPAMHIGHF